jgi:hypothetical protein
MTKNIFLDRENSTNYAYVPIYSLHDHSKFKGFWLTM